MKEGRLRLLAVTTPRRSPSLPDVPTIAQSGLPGYEFTGWMGLLVPVKVSRAIVMKLHADTVRIVHLPDVKQRNDMWLTRWTAGAFGRILVALLPAGSIFVETGSSRIFR